jgi:catechol 2,3-dioxygenase-like lactoylglutathione lyase family enzyme
MITKLDFVGVPSTDAERSRHFYVETLGLRPDSHGKYEFWVGDTCFGIWEPASLGMEFAPQKNAHPALHVDDVAAARAELEAKGVEFAGDTLDTGVCHMALFTDPDGNDLMLHHRYAPVDAVGHENATP